MMRRFTEDASRIFLACGSTDFRKQIPGLIATVTLQFNLDPYNGSCVFIFCNKKRDSIKVLRYDENGFLLATKKLLDHMKFQWPHWNIWCQVLLNFYKQINSHLQIICKVINL